MIQLTGKRAGEIQHEVGQIMDRLETLQREVPDGYVVASSNLSVALDALQKVRGHLVLR